jgi:hypothetical protein
MTVRPIFLLSLPRSGSTLVQRVLAAHEGVATAPEPWIALPQVYALRDAGAYAEYGHALAARAIGDFARGLRGGEDAYWAEVRSMLERLYAAAAGPADRFFVDKTPRYHFVAEDLFRLFPRATFVFLWRNPLAVVASTVETWGRGRWMVERWRGELFEGLDRLVRAFEAHREGAYAARYEDLVLRPEESWPPLFEHVGIAFDPGSLRRFADVELEARMGDPTGRRRYAALSTEPLERWKRTMSSPLRKRWCRSYLRWIGQRRLEVMGYRLDALLEELDAAPSGPRSLPSDLVRTVYAGGVRRSRRAAGGLLWKTSRGGEARSVYERPPNGQTSKP